MVRAMVVGGASAAAAGSGGGDDQREKGTKTQCSCCCEEIGEGVRVMFCKDRCDNGGDHDGKNSESAGSDLAGAPATTRMIMSRM